MAIFNSYVSHYQRVCEAHVFHHRWFVKGNVSPGLHLLRHQLGELRIGEVIAEALHGDGNDGLKLRRSWLS